MKYQLIEQLIEAIKEEDVYKNYIKVNNDLNNDKQLVNELLTMQRLNEEYQSLKKYGQYVNTDELRLKMRKQREIINSFETMINYQKASNELNHYLDEITQIVFKDISNELEIGRLGKLYARHCG